MKALMLACVVLLSAACVAPAAVAFAAPHRFSFRDAEFMNRDDAAQAVRAFLASSLPAGLPVAEARTRLVDAEMTCWTGRETPAKPSCSYSMPTHADGGVIGDDTWAVRLSQDGRGRVATWAVDHNRVSSNP